MDALALFPGTQLIKTAHSTRVADPINWLVGPNTKGPSLIEIVMDRPFYRTRSGN